MNFGEQVRELRVKKGLSQAELAQMLGVSRRTIVSYEQGTTCPRFRSVYGRLAECLGVNAEALQTEDKAFAASVREASCRTQVAGLKATFAALMNGDGLSPREKEALLFDLMETFFDAKRASEETFRP